MKSLLSYKPESPQESPLSIIKRYLSTLSIELSDEQQEMLKSSRFLKSTITDKTKMGNICDGYKRLIERNIRKNQSTFSNIDIGKTKAFVGLEILLKINPHYKSILSRFNKDSNFKKDKRGLSNFFLESRRSWRDSDYNQKNKGKIINQKYADSINFFLKKILLFGTTGMKWLNLY